MLRTTTTPRIMALLAMILEVASAAPAQHFDLIITAVMDEETSEEIRNHIRVSTSDLPYSLQSDLPYSLQSGKHRENVQNVVRKSLRTMFADDVLHRRAPSTKHDEAFGEGATGGLQFPVPEWLLPIQADSPYNQNLETAGDGVDVYIVNRVGQDVQVPAALSKEPDETGLDEPVPLLSAGDILNNLDDWFEAIASDWDIQEVEDSFEDQKEFEQFFNALIQGPSGSISNKRFLVLLDEFIKTLLYWWFQLHFLEDGEIGEGANIPDWEGYTWEALQPEVIRNRASHWEKRLLRVGQKGWHEDDSGLSGNETSFEDPVTPVSSTYGGYDPWGFPQPIAVTLLRAAARPDIAQAIETHVVESRKLRLEWGAPGSQATYVGNDNAPTGFNGFIPFRTYLRNLNDNPPMLKDMNDHAPMFEALKSHNDGVRAVMRAALPAIAVLRTNLGCSPTNQGCEGGYPFLMGSSDTVTRVRTTVPGQPEEGTEEVDISEIEAKLNYILVTTSSVTTDSELSYFDTKPLVRSFVDGNDLDELFKILDDLDVNAEVPEDVRKRFMDYFDEAAKSLFYFWFQLHFMDDGESDTVGDGDGAVADYKGLDWQEFEDRVIRFPMLAARGCERYCDQSRDPPEGAVNDP